MEKNRILVIVNTSLVLIIPIAFESFFIGVLAAAALCLCIAPGIDSISETFKDPEVFSRSNQTYPRRIAQKLKSVKLAKMSGNYQAALTGINEVLEIDPNHPEALFMKAQVLIEGYDNPSDAGAVLVKIMNPADKKNFILVWRHFH